MVVTRDPAPRALRKLFLDLFTASELRRLVGDYYDDAVNSLPLGGSSEELAASVVEVLARFGHIEPRLFARILADRPHQSEAVRRCAAVWSLEPADTAAEQPATRALWSGSLLGKYRLIERIGHGGPGRRHEPEKGLAAVASARRLTPV